MSKRRSFIDRRLHSELIRLSSLYAVVVVTGPRQSGKTALCKHQFPDYHYVNLENPSIREQILTAPKAYLEQYVTGLIVDEVQHLPELFSYMQIIVDETENAKFVLTGSSNFSLLQGIIIGRKSGCVNLITPIHRRNWFKK